jgi:hypothetical protein
MVKTHDEEGILTQKMIHDQFSGSKYDSSSLKLMKSEGTYKEINEITFHKDTKVTIEFSPNGKYLACLLR